MSRLPVSRCAIASVSLLLALGCSDNLPPEGTFDAGATTDAAQGKHEGGVTLDGGADTAPEEDAAPPEPPFDASGLAIVGSEGLPLCVLSDDGRYVVVTIANTGKTDTYTTDVRVTTDGSQPLYVLDLKAAGIAAGQKGTLKVDRGPLVGFVEDWKFSVVLDPDGKHGAPHAAVHGECKDLRSRAAAGMAPLATWYDTNTGLWNHTDWWTSANQLETVIDYSRETGDTTYIDEIDTTFTKNSANNFDKFGFYDDDGWWAVSWIKAYDLSHQQKYLDMAKTIFQRMTTAWDDKCGGGIYWAGPLSGSNSRTNKNAIPNELFLVVAARLHLRTPGDSGPNSYLDWAQREWKWFAQTGMINSDHLIVDGLDNLTDCKASGPIFTYNQGVVIGGLVDLAASTKDASYLDRASEIAHGAMAKMGNAKGILEDPPCGGDICVQFKGVLMRNLAYLGHAQPALDLDVYMRLQSDNLWNANKNDKDQFGYDWGTPFDTATAGRQSSALDALLAAVRVANMNLALFGTATGSAPCSATQTASNVVDGASRWDSKWCSGGAGGQSLTLDLGAPHPIVGFRLRHAGAGGENPAWNTRDFTIETSPDAQTWTNAVTVTGNTADVTTHPIPAVTARYARLSISAAQTATDFMAARIYEFEAYGYTP